MRIAKRVGLCIVVFVLCVIATVACRARFFAVAASADVSLPDEVYPDVGMIVDLLEEYDLFVIQTRDGNQWVMQGIEDWFVGDYCCLVFSDSGTRYERSDDWIVSIRYVATDELPMPSAFRNLICKI